MSTTKKTVIAIICANIALVLFAVCGKILTRFVYQDHLDDAVITVDGDSVTLRELGYYIYKVEDFVQDQALIYDPENPKHWWNTHFSAGLDSQFVCDYAKKVTLNTCICDRIYYLEANRSGFSLDDSAAAQSLQEAKELYSKMDSSQLAATGLTEDIIIEVHRKHTIASKYAESLAAQLDFSKYDKRPDELLNWDGEY